ncbi:MAG: asparagine synthase (glutamine-hydrolyzing) [Nitrospirota bacterium]
MCGIAGIFNLNSDKEISANILKRMAAVIQHRGPDGFGFYIDDDIGLAHSRLSIIDLEGGWQPIYNEDRTICIIFNGEIFNYLELRKFLIDKGHGFYTRSDTEVIIHLYEEYGAECLKHLNGQFAFAIWDKNKERLFIARDRVGIRPLFYTISNGTLLFASEIKSLFVDSRVTRQIDPFALDQIFTFWMTIPPKTAFKNVLELSAGHYMLIEKSNVKIERYWDPDFTPDSRIKTEAEYAEELRELLIDSTRLQLRADVPVGAYLSGGIDSSVITTLIKKYTNTPLRTFSVTFTDENYDESEYQKQMIDYLNTDHSDIKCTYSDIGKIFPDVIWHTEKPVLRTAPAPLFLLSKLVRDSGYKVVLTGEGSDEILAGYDIFKETKVRKFIERYPESRFRPLILKRLYPYLANSPVKSLKYADAFFRSDTGSYQKMCYSHIPRWNMTSKTKVFFSDDLKNELNGYQNIKELSTLLLKDISGYDSLSQAQYLEIKTLLPGYLLSSQGDRVAMAHSIEGRFPFLDHRLVEFSCKLPPHLRMNVLTEKYLLKESMKDLLPPTIRERTKQPYMAPDAKSFFRGEKLDYMEGLFSEANLKNSGFFNYKTVSALVTKCRQSPILGFKDNMAIVGIISTLLLYDLFIKNFESKSKDGIKQITEDRPYAIKA